MMRTYDSYKDSGIEWIGEIPSHWKSVKFHRYIFFQEGPGLRSYQFTDDGIQVICVTNITETGIDFTYKKYISETDYLDNYKHFTVVKGDYLLSSSGNSWGKISEYNGSKSVILNTSTIRLNTLNEFKMIKDLIKYIIKSNYMKIQLEILMTGSCQPNFGPSHLRQVIISLPSITEQEQIVSYLDEKTSLIDEMVEKKKRKIELLKEYRTSLINTVVTKGLNPDVPMKDSEIEWIGEIPRHWECVKGSRLGMYSKGSGIKKDEVVETGIPCIRYGQIYTIYNHVVSEVFTFITHETSKSSVKISKRTLLITGSGELKKDIGKCILYDGKEEIYVGGDIVILQPSSLFYPHYLTYLINSESIRIQKELLSKGEIIVHIYQKNFYDMRFPLPPLSEQEQIVTYLDEKTSEIDKTIELENKKIDLLKEYRQSLISNVVTGKIKVVSE